MKLFINAPNVHTGGGRVLLDGLFAALDHQQSGLLLLDNRFPLPQNLPKSFSICRVAPTVLGRLKNEWLLRNIVRNEDVVLCFGNLPPLSKLKGSVFVFVQNRYMIEPRKLEGFSFRERFRINFERRLLKWGKNRVTQYIVQTQFMQQAIAKQFNKVALVLPFISDPSDYRRKAHKMLNKKKSTYDFIYVAAGDPHKNHKRLVHAWTFLANEGLKPSLCLTIDSQKFKHLFEWIKCQIKLFNLNILIKEKLNHSDIEFLYKDSNALIYPSVFETIGLPLIEARCAGLPILASELDYVRDVVDPEETFDPNSATSIARAVKRFLGVPELPLPLIDAKSFLNFLLVEVD